MTSAVAHRSEKHRSCPHKGHCHRRGRQESRQVRECPGGAGVPRWGGGQLEARLGRDGRQPQGGAGPQGRENSTVGSSTPWGSPHPQDKPPLLSLFTSSEQQKLRLGGGRRAVSLEARRRRGQLQPCTCSRAGHLCREVVARAEGGPAASAVVASGSSDLVVQ